MKLGLRGWARRRSIFGALFGPGKGFCGGVCGGNFAKAEVLKCSGCICGNFFGDGGAGERAGTLPWVLFFFFCGRRGSPGQLPSGRGRPAIAEKGRF